MKKIEIKSNNIKSCFYDENRKELYIFFHSKHLYIYECDTKTYESFVSSSDKDAFFSTYFRTKDFIAKF